MSQHSEDVEGFTIELGPERITFSRMAVAHSLIWSVSELHTRAREDGAGRSLPPLATGPWVAAVVAGLFERSQATRLLRESGVELGGLVEIDITYRGPVFGDDLIRARCTVCSCAPPTGTTDPDGRIVIEDECFAADDRHLLTSTRTYRWTATHGVGA